MNNLEGVYWDLDGTIANTELEAHLPAFNKTFNDFGINWFWDDSTYIDLLKVNGGRNRIAYFSSISDLKLSDELINQIHKKKQLNYLNLIEDNVVTFKNGVQRLISDLVSRNVRQFIVTSSSKIQVQTLIRKLFGKTNPFEFFITSDDVNVLKPDPCPYLEAVNLSGIRKYNSVVFEDSNAGVISSTTAKLPTICIKSNIPNIFNSNLKLNCLVDNIGDEETHTNVLIGPKTINKYIDYDYLVNYLKLFK